MITFNIEYQEENEKINIFFMNLEFSFKPDKLDDDSLIELIKGISSINSKRLNKIIKQHIVSD